MQNKIKKAIQNNNDLYEIVFKPHRINSHRTNSLWYCLEKTPPLYSNLVSVSADWTPDKIFKTVELNFEREKWERWSIKDSFARLNLKKYGFKKLFDAQWIYLEAANFKPSVGEKKLRYKIADNEKLLSAWRLAWDSDERLGKEIFRLELLDDPNAYFIAGFDDEKIMSGCFINRTDNVLGISNFFALNDNATYWAEMISFVFDSIERADIVGYERRNTVEKLRQLGFEAVGELIVWLKSRI